MMTTQADEERARELLAQLTNVVDPGLELEPISGVQSLNNQSWLVRDHTEGVLAILRIADVQSDHWLGIDRVEEERIARAAADAGLGPEVLAADPATGLLLTQHIKGEPWEPHRGEPSALGRLTTAVRTLHALSPTAAAPRGIFERIRDLLAAAVELGGLDEPTHQYEDWLQETEALRETSGVQHVVGHNGLWPNNTLDDGHRLRLVDWEFSGLSDPLFDLATIRLAVDSTHVPTARLLAFLDSDHSGIEAPAVDDLERMTCAVQLFELGWSGVRLGLPSYDPTLPGFDFAAHAAAIRRTVDERLNETSLRWSA
jgi:thiamine kinase-like enzyme